MPESFWSAPIETVLAELAARPDGLSQIEADRRLLRLGPNRRSDGGASTPLGLLLNQFRSPLVILLLFAMTLSLVTRTRGRFDRSRPGRLLLISTLLVAGTTFCPTRHSGRSSHSCRWCPCSSCCCSGSPGDTSWRARW
jgi:magnesium-transporting ATPase (P-type)